MSPIPSVGIVELLIIGGVICFCLLAVVGIAVGVYFLTRDRQPPSQPPGW